MVSLLPGDRVSVTVPHDQAGRATLGTTYGENGFSFYLAIPFITYYGCATNYVKVQIHMCLELEGAVAGEGITV